MTHYRSRILLVLFAFLLAGVRLAAAEEFTPAEVGAMRKTIEGQLDAFRRDDGVKAFSYASPSIQERFGTPQQFLQMVRQQYSAVYRPAAIAFLKPRSDGGIVVYPVQLTDQEGRVWMALYAMQLHGKVWKISGCQVVLGAALST